MKAKPKKRGPAKLPSGKALERLLPHDERLPRRFSAPGKKHVVVIGVIVALLIIAAILLNVLHIVPWELGGKDAAVVNGERIPMADVDAGYEALHPQIKAQFTREQFLNETIIPQVLILQEAEKKGIAASDDEVQAVVGQVLEAQNMTPDQLDAKLQEVNLEKDAFLEMIRKRLIIGKALNATLPPADVTDEEVASFYEINKGYFATTYGNVTMADVKDGIRQYLLQQKQQMALQQYVNGLRAKATIVVNSENFK